MRKTRRDVTPHQENLRLLTRGEKVQCKWHGIQSYFAFPHNFAACIALLWEQEAKSQMCMIEPPEWYRERAARGDMAAAKVRRC